MILIFFLVVSIVIGYLRKGRLSNYLEAPLRGLFLPIIAFGLEAAFGFLRKWLPWPTHIWLGVAVSIEYAMVFSFVFLNRKRKGFWVIMVASLLNFIVIVANDFRMPITPVVYDYTQFANIVERVSAGGMVEYVLVGWDAPLWWLGDTIPVLWIFPGLASVGDLGLALGMFILIQEIMCPKEIAKAKDTADQAQLRN